MKRPNLFLVGEPKSGTTSMQRYLAQHPDVFMCDFKEPRFFATDLHRESDAFHGGQGYFPIRSEAEYLALFSDAGAQRVIGEASPHYLFSLEAAAAIQRFAPDAKVLILLRDPVDFLHSWHTEMVARLHEDEESLEAALALEPERRRGRGIPRSTGTPSFLYYSEWTKYAEHIRRFQERFPADRIKIVVFEELVRDTPRLYREVLEFIGVSPDFEAEFSVHNPARVPRFKAIRRISRHPWVWGTARRLIPSSAYAAMDRALSSTLTREQQKSTLDEGLRSRLRNQLRPQVDELSRLLGRDFAALWRYAEPDDGGSARAPQQHPR
jgi:hypothetical protein